MNFAAIARESFERGAMQNAWEFSQALRLASDIGAEVILEIGAACGGTLYGWRQIASRVLALTLPDPEVYGEMQDHGAVVGYIDSHTPAAVDWVHDQLGNRPLDVLFIDGDHSYEGCAADYRDYQGFVRPGGLIMLHDIVYAPGVTRFWKEFTANHDGWYSVISPLPATHPVGMGVVFK